MTARLLTEAQVTALSARNRAARRTPLTLELEAIQQITREAWNNPDDWAGAPKTLKGVALPKGLRHKPVKAKKPSTPGRARRGSAGEGKRVAVPERDVLKACLAVLEAHPAVRLWWRQQTGAMPSPDGKRFLRFSFKGASDLMAVLEGGRFLAVECKASGKRATPEQQAFLDNVLDAGGYALCVDDAQSLVDYLRIVA